MEFILGAIACSTMVFVVMRLFNKFSIDNHQAIMFNYLIAAILGFSMYNRPVVVGDIVSTKWFWLALLCGFWFILSYVMYAVSSQRVGLSITAISSKMSVVIPVLFGVLLFKENISIFNVAGIIIAMAALYLVSDKKKEVQAKVSKKGKNLLLPIIIFLLTGFGDMLMKFCEQLNIEKNIALMSAFIYSVSLLFGIILVTIDLTRKKSKLAFKNVIGGFLLGSFNFFSTYFMFRGMSLYDNTFLFPVYNIGVVCVSTLCGLIFFRERLSKKNYFGLAFSVIAVILIAL